MTVPDFVWFCSLCILATFRLAGLESAGRAMGRLPPAPRRPGWLPSENESVGATSFALSLAEGTKYRGEVKRRPQCRHERRFPIEVLRKFATCEVRQTMHSGFFKRTRNHHAVFVWSSDHLLSLGPRQGTGDFGCHSSGPGGGPLQSVRIPGKRERWTPRARAFCPPGRHKDKSPPECTI